MWLCLANLSLYIKKAINIQISNLSREFKSPKNKKVSIFQQKFQTMKIATKNTKNP